MFYGRRSLAVDQMLLQHYALVAFATASPTYARRRFAVEPFYDGLRRVFFYGDRRIITRSYNSTVSLRPVKRRDNPHGDRAATVEMLRPVYVSLDFRVLRSP